MATLDVQRDWETIRSCLPDGHRELATEHGAIAPKRDAARITSADDLLRLILLHVGANMPLRQTVAIFAEAKGPVVSPNCLHKRMRKAAPYLQTLVARMTTWSAECARSQRSRDRCRFVGALAQRRADRGAPVARSMLDRRSLARGRWAAHCDSIARGQSRRGSHTCAPRARIRRERGDDRDGRVRHPLHDRSAKSTIGSALHRSVSVALADRVALQTMEVDLRIRSTSQ